MSQNKIKPKYLIFDIESVANKELIAKLRPGNVNTNSKDQDAVLEEYCDTDEYRDAALKEYRDFLMEKNGSDFIPYTYQEPISVAIAKVTEDFRLYGLPVLGVPTKKPHEICRDFWKGWKDYGYPTFVTFNGRGFDIPLMELSAFRFGISIPEWFMLNSKSFDQPRSRYNTRAHLDLCDILTNFGASRFNGGLNLAASILGKPGKMDVQGKMVQDMYDKGELKEINDYCCCDVLDTYFVFLRIMVLTGSLTLDYEQQLVQETKAWLEDNVKNTENSPFTLYLEKWGNWDNPWKTS